MLFSLRFSTLSDGVTLPTLVRLLCDGCEEPSSASRSRKPLHSSAKLSDLWPDIGLSVPDASNVLPVGDVKMLLRFMEGLRGLLSVDDDETRRKPASGTRSEDDCAGLMGWEDAPGRARPADSFCSIAS